MHIVADNLMREIQKLAKHNLAVKSVEFPRKRTFTFAPLGHIIPKSEQLDSVIERFIVNPFAARTFSKSNTVYHVTDHAHAHLVHALPAGTCGVMCHDIDSFGGILDVNWDDKPPFWFSVLALRILSGLKRASVVFHSTDFVRNLILQHGIVPPEKLVKCPYGVVPIFSPLAPGEIPAKIPQIGDAPFLLHVGSCLRRKRLDVAIDAFARLRLQFPHLKLVHAGQPLTSAHRKQIDRLGIGSHVVVIEDVPALLLRDLYRQAAITIVPSEREGFGLPGIEALACGSIVVVSSIPVFHEIAKESFIFAPTNDSAAWAEVISAVLRQKFPLPDLGTRVMTASKFSWQKHAEIIYETYQSLAEKKFQ